MLDKLEADFSILEKHVHSDGDGEISVLISGKESQFSSVQDATKTDTRNQNVASVRNVACCDQPSLFSEITRHFFHLT